MSVYCNNIYLNQDKKDQLWESSEPHSKIPPIPHNLTLPQHDPEIELQETEEKEVQPTFQRRPQFKINVKARRRSF